MNHSHVVDSIPVLWYFPDVIDFYKYLRFTHHLHMADAAPEIRPTGPARKPGVLANILAIVGFIILIIIVIWGLLHIVSLTTPFFSGMFQGGKKEITVTVPAQVSANTAFPVSWKYSSSNRGTYAILYQCAQGLKISVDGNAVPCGAAYTLGNATGSATMLPTLTGVKAATTSISILYIPSAAGTTGPEATGSANTRVVVGLVTTPVETPVVQKPVVEKPVVEQPKPVTQKPKPVYTAPKPVSPADLSVRIIAVGVIDSYTGAFVQRAPYSPSEVSAVQFDVQNVGGSPSGSYTFQAQIPTSQPYTFSSQVQPSLGAGAHVVNTLRFSPAMDGNFTVQIFGSDSRTSNNYASRWVTGAYNSYNYGYPQYQYPQPYYQYGY